MRSLLRERQGHRAHVAPFGALMALWSFAVSANSPLMPHVEYEKRLRSAEMSGSLKGDLFGDSTNLYNGSTEFTVTDIDLPGNSGLPVQLRRRFKVETRKEVHPLGGFGFWDIDVPYIYGTFPASTEWITGQPNSGGRCSGLWLPKVLSPHRVKDIWNGNFLHIPGAGELEILDTRTLEVPRPTDGNVYSRATRDGHVFRCVEGGIDNYPGEAFVAIDTNGVKYFFSTAAKRPAGAMKGTATRPGFGRTRVYFLATRVEDRFGNSVDYVYDNTGQGGKLLSIEASDGRKITLDYQGGISVRKATAHGRTWEYGYVGGTGTSGLSRFPWLSSVKLPNQSTWTYNYGTPTGGGGLNPIYTALDVDGGYCAEPDFTVETFTMTATHPSGATGVFEFPYTRLHRMGTPRNACVPAFENPSGNPDGPHELLKPDYFDLWSLGKKVITGPGLTSLQWTYNYGDLGYGRIDGFPHQCSTCPRTKTVTVFNPDGSRTQHKYGVLYEVTDGLHMGTTFIGADNVVRRTESIDYTEYVNGSTMPFPWYFGTNIGGDDSTSSMNRPIRKRTIAQDGVTFVWQVNANCQASGNVCYDKFAKPTSVKRSNTLGYSKSEEITYLNLESIWALGSVASIKDIGTGNVESKTTFNVKGMPWKTYAFDLLQQTIEYDASGNISSIADGRNTAQFKTAVVLSGWKRGIPTKTTFPATEDQPVTTRLVGVNDHGQITSVTDQNPFRTDYIYDPLSGDLEEIRYPIGEDDPQWESKFLAFERVAATEYGLADGHWRHIEAVGTARNVTYFDALWRPVVKRTYDTANQGGTQSFTVQRFDHEGRQIFASYPVRTLSNFNAALLGTKSFYDVIGRLTAVHQDSEHGVLKTTHDYLTGMQKRTTDPRLNITTTRYQAFDQPSYEMPTEIDHPLSISTYIRRDIFGKPLEVTRSGPGG